MFDGRWRTSIERGLQPVGANIRRTGITADHLTAFGLVTAVAAAIAIGAGALRGGLLLVILAAVPDLLDGAVAKASGTASRRGAFFDSVADRVTDALLFGGVAWYLATVDGGRAAILPLAVLALSGLISYERAKAESLGFDARGGVMERAERIILLCFGLLFDSLLVPILWLMLVLTAFTAVQRFVKVWRQASAERPKREPFRWSARRGREADGTARARGPSGARTPTPDLTCRTDRRSRPRTRSVRRSRRHYPTGSSNRRRECSVGRSSSRCRVAATPWLAISVGYGGRHWTGRALDDAVDASFRSYARYWVESFRVPTMSKAEIAARFTTEGVHHMLDPLAEGKGAILALPHLGGWEWAGRWVADQGIPITVVVEPLEPPELFEWFVGFRESLGMHVVPVGTGRRWRRSGRCGATECSAS